MVANLDLERPTNRIYLIFYSDFILSPFCFVFSGQAVVIGLARSPAPVCAVIFIAQRVRRFHCSSISVDVRRFFPCSRGVLLASLSSEASLRDENKMRYFE